MNTQCGRLSIALAAGFLAAFMTPGTRATSINEVAAVLVYPSVLNEATGSNPRIETFLTITNTSSQSIATRVFFISGATCNSCSFPLLLGPLDSEVIVVGRNTSGTTTTFKMMDTGASQSCTGANGFVVVTVSDALTGAILTDNLLTGNAVVVNYVRGETSSVGVVPFSGVGPARCRSCLGFDEVEFQRPPAIIASPFMAPDVTPGIDARLSLFTLGFTAGVVPDVDCNVIGTDPDGSQFSSSFSFGCWTQIRLADISPEYTYPNFGVGGGFAEQGWVLLDCSVNGARGGVHGMMSQSATTGSVLRRNSGGPALASPTSWSSLLIESVTFGDSHQFCETGIGSPDADGDGVGPGCDPCVDDPLDDSDSDGLCGSVDNCPLHSNSAQLNSDGDPYGDVCDLCPFVASSGSADRDGDGVGGACDPDTDGDGIANPIDPDDDNDGILDDDGDGSTDPCAGGNRINCDDNCQFDFNFNQRDRDLDAIGDACDPSDDLVGGGSMTETTGGPGLLGGPVAYAFSWEPELGAIGYNVYRGLTTDLRLGSYGTCYRRRITTRFTSLPENPSVGTSFFYLVTPVYSNREGSLGDRSNGTVRPITSPCN